MFFEEIESNDQNSMTDEKEFASLQLNFNSCTDFLETFPLSVSLIKEHHRTDQTVGIYRPWENICLSPVKFP